MIKIILYFKKNHDSFLKFSFEFLFFFIITSLSFKFFKYFSPISPILFKIYFTNLPMNFLCVSVIRIWLGFPPIFLQILCKLLPSLPSFPRDILCSICVKLIFWPNYLRPHNFFTNYSRRVGCVLTFFLRKLWVKF